MAKNSGGNFGRLSYFDPNTSIFKNQMGTNSDSITFPYEDYNMAIELIIREYNRYSCGLSNVSNEFKEYRYSTDNGTISFLGGSKVKDDFDGNFLTTNYTDVSMTNPSANTQECLGIESIDISYQSWFHPQVTIKFIDVRGATVMMQAENNYYNPGKAGSNSNIYKAFFSFPYPLFILKVKGFYGKGVTYKLAISKTKIDFDANSGNFIITADFIGHMYGIFADIPMTFLAIAPYTVEGRKYWKENVENGKFCFRGAGGMIQAPMVTFPKLKEIIAKVSQSFEYVTMESEGAEKASSIKSQIKYLDDLKNQYAKVFGNDMAFEVQSDKEHIFRMGSSNIDEYISECEKFYDMLKEYKSSFHPTDDAYYEAFGSDSTKNEIVKNLKNRYIQFVECKDNGIGYAPNKSRYNQAIEEDINDIDATNNIYLIQETKHSYEDFDNYVKDNKEVLNKIESRRNGLTNFSLYVISKPTGKTFEDIAYNDMNEERKSLEKKLALQEEKYRGFQNQFIEKALGFTPSIRNMYELAFAHMDTFLEIFYRRMHVIKNQLESHSPERQKSHYPDVHDEYTDTEKRIHRTGETNSISRADYLPPFTAFYKDNRDPSIQDSNGNTQKMVLRWPGEMVNSDDLTEVHFINDLLDASQMYFKESESIDENINSFSAQTFSFYSPSTNVTGFIPLTIYDLANNGKFKNPYLAVKDAINSNSNDMLGRLFMIFALRAFYYLSTLRDDYEGKDNNDDYSFGRLEAVNFFKAVGEINSPKFFEFIKKYADDKNERKERNEFIDYITTTKVVEGITDVWLDKESVNAGNNLFDKVGKNLQYAYHKPIENEFGFKFFPLETYDPATLKKDLVSSNALFTNKKYISANQINKYSGDTESFEVGTPLNGGSFFIIEDRDYLLNTQNNIKAAINNAKQELSQRDKINNFGNKNVTDFGKVRNKDFNRYSNNVEIQKAKSFYDKSVIIDINDNFKRNDIQGLILSGTSKQFKDYYIKYPTAYKGNCKHSLFDKPIYKIQDNIIAKACLFLFSVPLLGNINTGAINEISYNGIVPKSMLLREGALTWFERAKNNDNDFKFEGTVENKQYHFSKPRDGHWLAGGSSDCQTVYANMESGEYGNYLLYKLPVNRTNSREPYLEQYFLEWATSEFKKIEPLISDKSYYKDEDFGKGLNYKAESNIEIQNMLRDFYFKSCTTFDYYHGAIGSKQSNYNVLECSINEMKDAFKGFLDQLENIYGDVVKELTKNQNALNERIYMSQINDPFKNTDLKLSTYMTMKNLYDKWLCGLQNGEDTYRFRSEKQGSYELDNFIYCDNFFHDIGDILCINMTQMGDWLSQIIPSADIVESEGEIKIKSKSLYDFLTTVAEMAGGYLLAIPQKMMYTDLESIKKAFTPIPSCGEWDEDTSTYMFLYSYKPSERLGGAESGDVDMNGWSQEGDGFDLSDEDIVGKLFNDDGSVVPAFGVTFAKQNQAYFKNINLTSSTPAVTEVGIANTMNIASKAGEEVRKTTLFGQDIYKIYSNYSYECTVEMMGCMQIFPPMYFQLNNIPMWKGAYLIQKVKHSIRPGDITTTFTGVRQNKYTIPLTDSRLVGFIGKTNDDENENNAFVSTLPDRVISIKDTIADVNVKLNIANENDFVSENVTEKNPLICLTPAHGPETTKKIEWAWSTKLIDEYIIPMLASKKIIDKNGDELKLNIHRCNIGGKNTYKNGYSLRETEELIKKYGSKGVISVVPHWNGGGGQYYTIFDGKIIGDRKNENSKWSNPRNPKYRSDSVEFAKYMAAEVENFIKRQHIYKAPEGMFKNLNKSTHLLYTDSYSHDKTDPAVKVNCACLLTENWFADYGYGWDKINYNLLSNGRYTNGRAWLESDEGLTAIAEIHVNAIVNYISSL